MRRVFRVRARWGSGAGRGRAAASRPLCLFDHVGLGIPTIPFAKAGLLKTIVFAHGQEYWKRVRRAHRWVLEAATIVLTNSEFTRRRMAEYVPQVRTRTCLLGLSPNFTMLAEPPPQLEASLKLEAVDGQRRTIGERMLLLVARMDPAEREKGHRELLAALSRLRTTHPNVQVVFPGTGGDRSAIAEHARRLGVADAVFLPGHVPLELLDRLYRRCFAFAMPSTQEGFGLVYLEAMNYAKACVGCFDQGTEDVIVHGETGLLLHGKANVDEMVSVIASLLDSPENARRMGESGFRRLHEQFTAEQHQARVTAEVLRLL